MQPGKIKFKKKENKYIWKLVNKLNCEAQKPPSQLRFSLRLIVITITSDEPWNTEPHKTDRKSQVMSFSTHRRNLVFPKRSAKMIDSSVKWKRQLAFERQNSCVYEKYNNVWCCSRVLDDRIWHFFDKLFEMYESMGFLSVGLPRTVCALERIEMHQS